MNDFHVPANFFRVEDVTAIFVEFAFVKQKRI